MAANYHCTMSNYEQTSLFSVAGDRLVETTLSSEHLYQGKILNLRRDTVRLANDRQASREVVEHVDSAAAVPLLEDGRVVMVEQWRYPVGRGLLEIPAGILEAGEEPTEAMRRELTEETGYDAGRLELLLSVYLAPATLRS